MFRYFAKCKKIPVIIFPANIHIIPGWATAYVLIYNAY